ncbi:binding--dependent transport system inner membrane component family protein, partial [Vibrio parahaemolyticus EKP-028]
TRTEHGKYLTRF